MSPTVRRTWLPKRSGTSSETADGIAHVEGLPGTMANELLRFEDGTLGLAMNLDQRDRRRRPR